MISFPKGAMLKIIDKNNPQWFMAEYNGAQGFVPSSYVEITAQAPATIPAAIPAPIQTPASIPAPIRTPASIPAPIQTPASIPAPIQTPASIPAPIQTPAAQVPSGNAVAVFDYTPQRQGLLSFSKGQVLKIVSKDNPDWWKAELNGTVGFVPSKYLKESQVTDVRPSSNVIVGVASIPGAAQKVNNEINIRSTTPQIVVQTVAGTTQQPASNNKQATAIYDFAATAANMISFSKGQVLTIIDTSNPQWFKAELNGAQGFVPSQYLQMNEASTRNSLSVGSASELRNSNDRNSQSRLSNSRMSQDISSNSNAQVTPSPIAGTPQKQETQVKVIYEFTAQRADMLSLKVGEVYTLLDKSNEAWWKVSGNGKEGLVPATYCEIVSQQAGAAAAVMAQETYIAVFDFDAPREDMLSFKRNQIFVLNEKVSDEWLRVTMDGRTGLVPAKYLKEHKASVKKPAPKYTPPPSLLTIRGNANDQLARAREEARRKEEEERRKRLEELETHRRLEAERLQRLVEEQKRREEEERQRREGEERRKREEEEARRRAEQERVVRENEERRRREEEKKRREEEERRRREEEAEERRREHEAKQRALEEARKRAEEERIALIEQQRREQQERQQRELKEREEAARRAAEEMERRRYVMK